MPAERPPPSPGQYRDVIQACGKAVRHLVIACRAGTGQRDVIRGDVGVASQRGLMPGHIHELSESERWRQPEFPRGVAQKVKQLGRCRGRPERESQRTSHTERHDCTVAPARPGEP